MILKNYFFLIILILFLTSCGQANHEQIQETKKEVKLMKVTSLSFNNGEKIPQKFTCKGENINPELIISEIPETTESLVLIMDDPDAPGGTWNHWILFNIPSNEKINENSIPNGAIQGKNSWGKNEYSGPCPPSGTHRYIFKLYALDKKLNLGSEANKKDIEITMKDSIIAEAKLMGLSTKQ